MTRTLDPEQNERLPYRMALPYPRVDGVSDEDGNEWTAEAVLLVGGVDVVVGQRRVAVPTAPPDATRSPLDQYAVAWGVLVGLPERGAWRRVAFGTGSPHNEPACSQALACLMVDGAMDRIVEAAE